MYTWCQVECSEGIPPLPAVDESSFAGLVQMRPPGEATTNNSSLFQSLPGELRRRILMTAFGDRTVHMNLALEHPILEEYMDDTWDERHGQVPPRYAFDKSQERRWRWRGSVCHSTCFDHNTWFVRKGPKGPEMIGKWDACLKGGGLRGRCMGRRQDRPDECYIGAMGWLLTCKQAYNEGIEVLYRTNTVRVYGTYIFSQLPRLIRRAKLEDLVNVSLFWDLGPWRMLEDKTLPQNFEGEAGLARILSKLPDILPRVKRLHISFAGMLWQELQLEAYGNRCTKVWAATERVLGLFVRWVMRIESLVDFRVSLPRSIFLPWMQVVTGTDIWQSQGREAMAERLLRRVKLEEDWSDDEEDGMSYRAGVRSFWVFNGQTDLVPLVPLLPR